MSEIQKAQHASQSMAWAPSSGRTKTPHHAPDHFVVRLARLRVLVAWAGELATPPWWPTQYHSATARSWMNRVFPRTNFRARVAATTIAASRAHDRAIGGAARYHLFRLPIEIEWRVADSIGVLPNEGALHEPTHADVVSALAKIAGADPPARLLGQTRVGPLRDVVTDRAVATVAGAYLAALREGGTAFPYFSDQE